MSNMSYCVFENTSKDMYDAVDKIEGLIGNRHNIEDMSRYEARGLGDLLYYARQIVELEEQIEEIGELYDEYNR